MSRHGVVVLIVVWCGCVAVGLWALIAYELTPGATRTANSEWPVSSRLSRDANRPTLVVFFHPRCPCSRASLGELSKLSAHCEGRMATHIVFVAFSDLADNSAPTDLVRAAQRIPAARVSHDLEGAEAARFGATTSGEALLYAADGRLLFQGGLTASRGHEGDNANLDSLIALIETGATQRRSSLVYGCALTN